MVGYKRMIAECKWKVNLMPTAKNKMSDAKGNLQIYI